MKVTATRVTLGADPELTYANSGTAIVSAFVAENRRNKKGDEWVNETSWFNLKAFGKTAENCQKYLTKGRQVYIEGRLSTRKWQDKEGKDRYTTEVIANTVQFLGGGTKAEPTENRPALGAVDTSTTAEIDDDDIPF
jgi:single-strand DNA-binding protein